ncbi:condensation domain-containing protein, partial [Paenibacillus xylaniclasticus]|uniref:condensation domain-containing protein n=1 Tax=Paenibacillus xylaniclasticus TaxID=588083 RepID=UPI001FE4043F
TETEARLAAIWQEVLGIERVSVTDDFFVLGGHSIKAMELVSRVRKEFAKDFTLRMMFESPTIEGTGHRLSELTSELYSIIPKVQQQSYYPLSSAQTRLFVAYEMDRLNTAYNMPAVIELKGTLDRERAEQAVLALIERHEALRTTFEPIDGEIVQKIHATASFSIDLISISSDEQLTTIIQEWVRPFDLSHAPLVRIALVDWIDDRYFMLFDMHHIISDGVSMNIFIREFIALYNGQTLSPSSIQYKDYAVWQKDQLKSGRLERQEKYWLKNFSEEPSTFEFPTDYPRPVSESYEGNRLNYVLDKGITEGLKQMAQLTESTLFTVLLAAYKVWLSKWSGQLDVVSGIVTSGRSRPETEDVIGMFAVTLPLRSRLNLDLKFTDFVVQVKENMLEALSNQEYPMEELISKIGTRKAAGRNPLFDNVFSMNNLPVSRFELTGLEAKLGSVEQRMSKFDLMFAMAEIPEASVVNAAIEYKTALFSEYTVRSMWSSFEAVLLQIIEYPECQLGELVQAERKADPTNVFGQLTDLF